MTRSAMRPSAVLLAGRPAGDGYVIGVSLTGRFTYASVSLVGDVLRVDRRGLAAKG
jgi:hypothetical protein